MVNYVEAATFLKNANFTLQCATFIGEVWNIKVAQEQDGQSGLSSTENIAGWVRLKWTLGHHRNSAELIPKCLWLFKVVAHQEIYWYVKGPVVYRPYM